MVIVSRRHVFKLLKIRNEKKELRSKYNIDQESYLVGSFQRDTEGADLKSPKLSKGPDRFITIVKALSKEFPNLMKLIKELQNLNIIF